MFSTGMTFQLQPGCYDEYKQAHDNLWPEIAASMADNQVSMAIYRFGDRLFLHAVAPSESDWEKSREHPALEKWHAYMASLMITDEHGDTVVHELEEAFCFGLLAT
jgi:L-rhamnose mutarotase